MDGFEGMIALVDRHSGKTLGIPSGRVKKPCMPLRRWSIGCVESRRRLVAARLQELRDTRLPSLR
jgi:hypothetical protein